MSNGPPLPMDLTGTIAKVSAVKYPITMNAIIPHPSGPGRPLVQINLSRVRELAALGLTVEQIADRIGVCRRTLFSRMSTDLQSVSQWTKDWQKQPNSQRAHCPTWRGKRTWVR